MFNKAMQMYQIGHLEQFWAIVKHLEGDVMAI
jgi:hypothetical protein